MKSRRGLIKNLFVRHSIKHIWVVLAYLALSGVFFFSLFSAQAVYVNNRARSYISEFTDGYYYLPRERYFIIREIIRTHNIDINLSGSVSIGNATTIYFEYLQEMSDKYQLDYAIAPHQIHEEGNNKFFTIDFTSYHNIHWEFSGGRGFSERINEVIVINSSKKVGDIVVIEKYNETFVLEVVGVLNFNRVLGVGGEIRPRLLVHTDKLFGHYNSYLVHPNNPISEPAISDVFIKSGSDTPDFIKKFEESGKIYSIQEMLRHSGGTQAAFLKWLIILISSGIGFIIFSFIEPRYRFKKFRADYQVYLRNGYDKKTTVYLLSQMPVIPVFLGMIFGSMFRVSFYKLMDNIFFEVAVTLGGILLYAGIQWCLIKKVFWKTIGNIETDYSPNTVAAGYQLIEDMTVLENVMFPLTAKGYSNYDARMKAQDILRILKLHYVKDDKCSKINPHSKSLVRIARACAAADENVILVENIWDVFTDEEKKHTDRVLEKVQEKLNIQIVWME